MRKIPFLLLGLLLASVAALAEGEVKRYLYMSSPDGAQAGGSGNGILVFDIDDGHRFVRWIDIPIFKEGLRGFCGNAKTHCVYYSTTNRRLGCFDLEKNEVVWERQYGFGCDRSSITPDGTKIYVPTGWWWQGGNSGFLVVNAENGELLKEIPVNIRAHNSIASLNRALVYLGTETTLTIFRTTDDSVVRTIEDVGESGVFPFTIDSRDEFAYVCLGKHVGFDVVNLRTGEVPHRVLAGQEPIPHRTHGVGLTPDETELWISDQVGKKLFVFDAGVMPPKATGQVDLTAGGHGWITFSLDGRFAWCHTPDVIDVRSKKIVATLKDGNGNPVSGSKFIEVHFKDGKVVNIGHEFGLGRARLAGRIGAAR